MSNMIEHAKREFLALGYKPIEKEEDGPNKWIQENVLELLEVFSRQGHSGFSANFAINYFKELATFNPLSPLKFDDDEWNDVSEEIGQTIYQNNRLSSVFKDGKNGKPYYLDAVVFRTENGATFTGPAYLSNGDVVMSRQYIDTTKEFLPKTFYIDVLEDENGNFVLADDGQLNSVIEYYNVKLKKNKEK